MEKIANIKEVGKKAIATGLVFSTLLLPKFLYSSQKSRSAQKEKSKVSFILGVGKGIENNELSKNKSPEIELGIKYNRFALVGNIPISSHRNINLQTTEEEMMKGVYFQGKKYLGDFSSSIGASLEYHQPLAQGISWVTGIGGNLEKRTRNIEENLVRRVGSEESLLASKINSILEKEFVLNVHIGPSFKIFKGLELNPNLGYEIGSKKNGLKRGMYVNFRAILPLSFPGKKGDR